MIEVAFHSHVCPFPLATKPGILLPGWMAADITIPFDSGRRDGDLLLPYSSSLTPSETRLLNETLFDQLSQPGMSREAVDAVNDFTRARMREDGFYRRIMPPVPIANDELDRSVDTDLPVRVVDREEAAQPNPNIPFGTLPLNPYIRGPRWRHDQDRVPLRVSIPGGGSPASASGRASPPVRRPSTHQQFEAYRPWDTDSEDRPPDADGAGGDRPDVHDPGPGETPPDARPSWIDRVDFS